MFYLTEFFICFVIWVSLGKLLKYHTLNYSTMILNRELISLILFNCFTLVALSSVFDESPDGLLEDLQNHVFTPGDVSTYPTLYNQNRILLMMWKWITFDYLRPFECSGTCYFCIHDVSSSRDVIVGTDLDYRFSCLYMRFKGLNESGAYIAHLKYKGKAIFLESWNWFNDLLQEIIELRTSMNQEENIQILVTMNLWIW